MQRVSLEVQPRDLGQPDVSRNMNQLRMEGWVPGVIYGHGKPVQIAVDLKAFKKALQTEAGANALFNMKLGKKTELGMIKEIQRDIFTQTPIHVDLYRIDIKEKIEVHVPIRTVGEPIGVKEHEGILEHIQREVDIKCLPDKIPPHVNVDVSHLDIHQSIRVSELKLDEGVEMLTPGDYIVANVVLPKIEEEPAPAPEELVEGAEPEVIAKGKEKEEGEEKEGKEGAEAKGKPEAKAKPEAKESKK